MKKLLLVCGFLVGVAMNVNAIDLIQFYGLYSGQGIECSMVTTEDNTGMSLIGDVGNLYSGTTYEIVGEIVESSICQAGITVNVEAIAPKSPRGYRFEILKGDITGLTDDNVHQCYILNDGENNYGLIVLEDGVEMNLGKYTVIGEKMYGKFNPCGADVVESYKLIKYFKE
jgi:hypothetical protein